MTSAEVERRVREVVGGSLGVRPARLDGPLPLADLGLDSFGCLLLVERLEQTFGIQLQPEDLVLLTSVESVTRCVARRSARA